MAELVRRALDTTYRPRLRPIVAGFWVNLACGQDEADEVDYPACSAALDSAACVETDEGMALAYPSAECGDSQP